jgi:hypothetical protein
MFGKKTNQRLDRLERQVDNLDRYVDNRDYEHSLRRQVQRLQDELALLIQALGLVRVSRKIDAYERKGGPERGEAE